jgi:hypothetical protein
MENDSRQPRDLLKSWHNDILKMVHLTLSQGMLKKGNDDDDEIDDEVDDEVRTTVPSHNQATAMLTVLRNSILSQDSALIPNPSYQQRAVGGGGQEVDGQSVTYG